MTALCILMPLVGALTAVRDMQSGWVGYGLAIIVGVPVGVLCAWAMRSTGNYFVTKFSVRSDTNERYFRVLYVVAVGWIILALFLGSIMTAAVMHHICSR